MPSILGVALYLLGVGVTAHQDEIVYGVSTTVSPNFVEDAKCIGASSRHGALWPSKASDGDVETFWSSKVGGNRDAQRSDDLVDVIAAGNVGLDGHVYVDIDPTEREMRGIPRAYYVGYDGKTLFDAEVPPHSSASKAFDGRLSSKWSSCSTNCHRGGGIDDNNAKFPIYLQFEPAGDLQSMNAYSILGYSDQGFGTSHAETMRSWRFQGTNDGKRWTTLDERSDETFTEGVYNSYFFDTAKSFRVYRFEILKNNGSPGAKVSVTDIKLQSRSVREVSVFSDVMSVEGKRGVDGWQTYEMPHATSARYVRLYVVDNFGFTQGGVTTSVRVNEIHFFAR